jgi:hypothetical protein
MLFDREGLEMATHERLAEYHASLFPANATVFDLTTGVGADLIAIARRGPAIGFEVDPVRRGYARHNVAAHGLDVNVRAESWEVLAEAEYYFLDPARRTGGRRTLNPDEFEPNPLQVISVLSGARLGVLKLSPMLPDVFLESFGGVLEFLSFGGECREALVILGEEASSGRFAVHVESGERIPVSAAVSEALEPGNYLYEADPSAIRAHALGTLARQFGISPLGNSNGYLTGDQSITSIWLKAFRVLAFNRFDVATLRKDLAELGASTPVLKQKGSGHDLDALRRKLILNGSRELVVALYTVGKSLRYAVAEPVR